MNFLANLADIYNPALLIICLIIALHRGIIKKDRYGFKLLLSALIVYALMFADKYWQLWPRLGLDYSTHTASALAMCVFIGVAFNRLAIRAALCLSLLIYGELMVVLKYHSWSDIFSTAIIIALLLIPIFKTRTSN